MDLRALRYFIAVVEVGSLSRAAHSLYVAQPALTAQIKKLEAELGAQLLERSHAGVTPTPAGTQLYQDARRLLSDAEAMGERIRRLPQGPEGSVTIAVPFLLTTLLLRPVIAQLSQTHPRIRVFVLDGLSLTVQKAVLERRADIGIVVDTPALPGLDCRPMAQEDILLTGLDRGAAVVPLLQGDPGGGLPSLAFAHASRLPLVLQSRRFAIRQSVEAAAEQRGLRLNIVHEHDSARVIRSLYHCGAGFTFSPACTLAEVSLAQRQQSAAPGHWIVARVTDPALQRRYFVTTQASRADDAATAVVRECLLAHARSLIDGGQWQACWLLDASPQAIN